MMVDTGTMANQSIRVMQYIYLYLLAHLLFSGLSSSVIHGSQLTVSSVSWPVTTGHFGHPVFCGHRTFLLYRLEKRDMLFSGDLESRAVQLVMKVVHFQEILLWVEVGPHET